MCQQYFKIREYRIRAHISQLQLELAINASTGSISRIENGQINPTKETLLKIADVLYLNFLEKADLLGLQITEEELLNLITQKTTVKLAAKVRLH